MRQQWSMCTLVVLLTVSGLASPAGAFYCGRRVVALGDPQYKVHRVCGDPDERQWRVTYRAQSSQDPVRGAPGTIYVPVVIEVWLYDFGPRRFVQEVSFENGRVVALQPLGYGYE